VQQVCSRRGVTALEICSRRRTRAVAAARHELWCLIREHPERCYSYPEIATIFGCDHTAIMHGIGAHRARAAAASR
jgi:chromosomal replication initiation ATPase DnaA